MYLWSDHDVYELLEISQEQRHHRCHNLLIPRVSWRKWKNILIEFFFMKYTIFWYCLLSKCPESPSVKLQHLMEFMRATSYPNGTENSISFSRRENYYLNESSPSHPSLHDNLLVTPSLRGWFPASPFFMVMIPYAETRSKNIAK